MSPRPPPLAVARPADAPLANPMESRIGYQLRRASIAMVAGLSRSLQALELNLTEASVLMMLLANPGATQSAIGRALGIKSANMAPLIGKLQARGLVERAAADGRSHALRLSAAGTTLAQSAERVTARHDKAFFRADPDPAGLRARLNQLWRGADGESGQE